MSVDSKSLVAELTADLVAARFARGRGLGVFVENMPALEASVLLGRLANPSRPPRVALLGLGANKVKEPKGCN